MRRTPLSRLLSRKPRVAPRTSGNRVVPRLIELSRDCQSLSPDQQEHERRGGPPAERFGRHRPDQPAPHRRGPHDLAGRVQLPEPVRPGPGARVRVRGPVDRRRRAKLVDPVHGHRDPGGGGPAGRRRVRERPPPARLRQVRQPVHGLQLGGPGLGRHRDDDHDRADRARGELGARSARRPGRPPLVRVGRRRVADDYQQHGQHDHRRRLVRSAEPGQHGLRGVRPAPRRHGRRGRPEHRRRGVVPVRHAVGPARHVGVRGPVDPADRHRPGERRAGVPAVQQRLGRVPGAAAAARPRGFGHRVAQPAGPELRDDGAFTTRPPRASGPRTASTGSSAAGASSRG